MNEYLRTTIDKFELLVRIDFHYTKDDLWVNFEDGKVRVGVSDYLQKTSGDIAFVELAQSGSTLEKDKEFGTIESAKTTISLLSPVSGIVNEANTKLAGKPELANLDPYGEGWLVTLTPSNLEDNRSSFLSADDYFKLMLEKLRTEDGKLESR